jgi:hypothetical protein
MLFDTGLRMTVGCGSLRVAILLLVAASWPLRPPGRGPPTVGTDAVSRADSESYWR